MASIIWFLSLAEELVIRPIWYSRVQNATTGIGQTLGLFWTRSRGRRGRHNLFTPLGSIPPVQWAGDLPFDGAERRATAVGSTAAAQSVSVGRQLRPINSSLCLSSPQGA